MGVGVWTNHMIARHRRKAIIEKGTQERPTLKTLLL